LKVGDRVVIHAVKVKDVLQAHDVRFSEVAASFIGPGVRCGPLRALAFEVSTWQFFTPYSARCSWRWAVGVQLPAHTVQVGIAKTPSQIP
jgi:hypothetical protein